MQISALDAVVRENSLDGQDFVPAGIAVVIAAIGRTLILEETLGATRGHREAVALVNRFIDRFEGSGQDDP
jgi:hypothetical protein